jgi:hypothetical protein
MASTTRGAKKLERGVSGRGRAGIAVRNGQEKTSRLLTEHIEEEAITTGEVDATPRPSNRWGGTLGEPPPKRSRTPSEASSDSQPSISPTKRGALRLPERPIETVAIQQGIGKRDPLGEHLLHRIQKAAWNCRHTLSCRRDENVSANTTRQCAEETLQHQSLYFGTPHPVRRHTVVASTRGPH